jgi:Na+-transporting methylmalonyl-CoA/oxaloacetate decarboxylase gamma subunit
MYLRTVLIIFVLTLLAFFVAMNWSAFMAQTTLSVGFTTVEAPLGLILIGITGILTLLFLIYVVYWQSSALIESRRHARELQSQRELAERAEVSRFEQLRSAVEAQLRDLENQNKESSTAVLARLDELERQMRSTVEQSGNTLAAYLDQIEDRLERTGDGQK